MNNWFDDSAGLEKIYYDNFNNAGYRYRFHYNLPYGGFITMDPRIPRRHFDDDDYFYEWMDVISTVPPSNVRQRVKCRYRDVYDMILGKFVTALRNYNYRISEYIGNYYSRVYPIIFDNPREYYRINELSIFVLHMLNFKVRPRDLEPYLGLGDIRFPLHQKILNLAPSGRILNPAFMDFSTACKINSVIFSEENVNMVNTFFENLRVIGRVDYTDFFSLMGTMIKYPLYLEETNVFAVDRNSFDDTTSNRQSVIYVGTSYVYNDTRQLNLYYDILYDHYYKSDIESNTEHMVTYSTIKYMYYIYYCTNDYNLKNDIICFLNFLKNTKYFFMYVIKSNNSCSGNNIRLDDTVGKYLQIIKYFLMYSIVMKVNNEYYKNMRDVQEIPNHVYSRFYNNFIRNKLDINYPDILENLCEYAYNCRNFYSDLLRRDIRYYNSNNIDTVGDVFTNRGTIDINDEILNNINLIEGDYEYMRVSPRNMLQVLGTIMDTRPDGQLVFHPGRLERRRSYPQRR